MVGDLLRHFQLATVLQISRDTGRAKRMGSDSCFDAGRFRTTANTAVSVLLEEGIGGELASFTARGAEVGSWT